MIPDLSPQDIQEMETKELWKTYEDLYTTQDIEHTDENKQEHDSIKNGIKTRFPITYIINEWYEMYPTTRKAKVIGYGKIPIQELLDEIQNRETLMRQKILEITQDGDPLSTK